MFTIRKINKRKDYKKFVKFPTKLYKDNKHTTTSANSNISWQNRTARWWEESPA